MNKVLLIPVPGIMILHTGARNDDIAGKTENCSWKWKNRNGSSGQILKTS
jgi:hypothetical protein